MKKKIMALIVLCLIAMSLMTVPAFADDTVLHVKATADMTIGNDIKSTKPETNSEKITVQEYKWYKYNGSATQNLGEIAEGETFALDTTYVLSVVFNVPEGYQIHYRPYSDDTLNGSAAGYSKISEDNRTLTRYYVVDTAKEVSDFKIRVDEPVAGEIPSAPKAKLSAWDDGLYTVDSYTWFYEGESGIKCQMAEGQRFESGVKYTLNVTLDTDKTKALVANNAAGTLNGTIASSYSYITSDTHIGLDFELGAPSKLLVKNVDITVKESTIGETLDFTPTVVSDPADSVSCEVKWYVYDIDEDDWKEITDKTTKAEAEKYYSYEITFKAKDGYVINDSITVNGEAAEDDVWENDDDEICVNIEGNYTTYGAVEIPFRTTVKLGGSASPAGEHTFNFIVDATRGYYVAIAKAEAKVTTNGEGTFEGTIKLYGSPELIDELLEGGGIYVSEEQGDEEGWTYSDETFCICKEEDENGTNKLCFYTADYVEDPNWPGYLIPEKGEKIDKIEFVNIYTSNAQADGGDDTPVTPGNESSGADPSAAKTAAADGTVNVSSEKIQSVNTSDNSNFAAWTLIFIASAATLAGAAVKKKREVL